jgi:hypothetical protein
LFGEPSRVAEFKNPGISLQVLKWDADKHPEQVAFYADQAIPLFPSERAFVIENGAPALRESWRSSQVPFWNPHRAEG